VTPPAPTPAALRRQRRGRAWLELLRPANVTTALAVVLAGVSVAGLTLGTPERASALGWLLVSTACLYAGGIVLNDVFDRHLDARERPERPLASGRVTAGEAALLGGVLLASGVAAAAAVGSSPAAIALAIAGAVVAYDAVGKRHALLGPVNMGLCRALNLLLGVAISEAALRAAWPLALIPLVYIAAVTVVSRGEVHGARQPVLRAGLGLVATVVAVLAAIAATGGAWAVATAAASQRIWALLLVVALGSRVLPAFAQAARTAAPVDIRRAVRTGVLSLVLLDAVIAASYAGIINSLAVLATGLLAWWLARRFAVT
jgi:4-hydroxybenzoate polyprenyltransferase